MKNIAITPANVLLPNGVDMQKWACIACDQFTSEPKYWEELSAFVGDSKSTLNLVLPEIYLDGTEGERIPKINQNIKSYLAQGVFTEYKNSFILTVRKTDFVERRIGLIGALDLELYDYKKGVKPLVRATEGTIEERIPPRLKIRKNADVEFPHVMVLFDDEKREITEPLFENRNAYKKLYDFTLNMQGGSIEGYLIEDTSELMKKFANLLNSERLTAKYGCKDEFLFAVGDGNHSLATAKTYWNEIKATLTEEEKQNHPARYALVEFVNIYDEGIYFEPIYRLVTGVDKKAFIKELASSGLKGFTLFDGEVTSDYGKQDLPKAISGVDEFIKNYISIHGGVVDYVHGEENIKAIVKSNSNSVGILFEKLDKADLFKYVSTVGAFPRKTFSMGEGKEKRYYLEGRKIVKC